MSTDQGTYTLADFGRLPGRFPFLALVPQWDFLDFLADQAGRYPTFRLRMNAEAVTCCARTGRSPESATALRTAASTRYGRC